MKVYIETMGCQMNRLDSELAASLLRAGGHEMVSDLQHAQVVLYNTCSVRRQAENKVCSRIGEQGIRKAEGAKIILGVLGCMAQNEGQKLLKKYPQVDLVCGPGQLGYLSELIEQAARGERAVRLDPTRDQPRDQAADERLDRLDLSRDAGLTGSPTQAFVRVSRGCDNFCTYCIVPFVRGGEVSRDPAQIIDEVRRLVDQGRSEITLLGQTVNSYRWQGGAGTVRFSDLLAKLAPLPGLRRLRFVTSHPLGFGDDILHAMRDLPNICRYLHIPAQSGSDAVLARMNRKYTRAQYDELIDRARAIMPDIVLAGDFIVGFPGETDEDHAASADLIRRSGYRNSFIFKYSPRPGTLAAKKLKDDVPTAVKRFRNNDLLEVQVAVGLEHHRQYVGQELEVLVEGPSSQSAKRQSVGGMIQLLGRTRGDHIVVFDGLAALANQYQTVRITKASSLTLTGELK